MKADLKTLLTKNDNNKLLQEIDSFSHFNTEQQEALFKMARQKLTVLHGPLESAKPRL